MHRTGLVILLAAASCTPSPPAGTAGAAHATTAVVSPPAPSVSPTAQAAGVDAAAADAVAPGPVTWTYKGLPLPGATAPVTLDYLAYDRSSGRVWVPVGDTGSVDVLDIASGTLTRVDGFKTAERDANGRKRVMGPSAASAGDGVVYVGNRATSEVCAVDARKLTRGKCLKLPSATDGVAYVAAAKEVWVTTPRDQSIAVLDASHPDTLAPKTVIHLDGAPEGYAVDDARGLFFTNLEDRDRTVPIDIRSHKPIGSAFSAGCGEAGPRGIAVDSQHGFVLVACTDHVAVLDGAHEHSQVSSIATGGGVDNIDWLESRRLVYVGAARGKKLTVAHVDDQGRAEVVATSETPEGARNPVVDSNGNAYEADPANARVLVFTYAGP